MSLPKLPPFTEATYLKPDVLVYKKADIDQWHAKVFYDAVEVLNDPRFKDEWYTPTHEGVVRHMEDGEFSVSGIVVNIQPIKKETANDILEELANLSDTYEKSHTMLATGDGSAIQAIAKRAKAFLKNKK